MNKYLDAFLYKSFDNPPKSTFFESLKIKILVIQYDKHEGAKAFEDDLLSTLLLIKMKILLGGITVMMLLMPLERRKLSSQ